MRNSSDGLTSTSSSVRRFKPIISLANVQQDSIDSRLKKQPSLQKKPSEKLAAKTQARVEKAMKTKPEHSNRGRRPQNETDYIRKSRE